tara:strand:+ start:138 stop:482 length:345 start_codon:yes stop_codon:yes gene_type:complete
MDFSTSRAGKKSEFKRIKDAIEEGNCGHFGCNGAFYIADQDTHTADDHWSAITMMEDTVFTTLTVANWAGDTFTGATEVYPKGLTIYGKFTVIDLTSGACIAYFGASNRKVTTA